MYLVVYVSVTSLSKFYCLHAREQDLRVQVADKDAQIKQVQEDLKKQINAKDEQIRQMQEDHKAEVEK